jgi:CheY-like chemotaxis protein
MSVQTDFLEEKARVISSKEPPTLPRGTRVLLVGDNPETVVLLRTYLDNGSLSLHLASQGIEALRERQLRSYDLILMDIQMPIMDGYAATREIRAWEKQRHMLRVPIVLLATVAEPGNGIEAGWDALLTKPVRRDELVATIVRFARSSGAPSDSIASPIAARRPAFLANRRLDLGKMQDALRARDFAAIQHIAHNCKGIGTGYGFPDISRIGSTIEIAARAFDAVELENLIPQFAKCIQTAEE